MQGSGPIPGMVVAKGLLHSIKIKDFFIKNSHDTWCVSCRYLWGIMKKNLNDWGILQNGMFASVSVSEKRVFHFQNAS